MNQILFLKSQLLHLPFFFFLAEVLLSKQKQNNIVKILNKFVL